MTSVHTKQCAGFQTAVVFFRQKKGVLGLSRCFAVFNVFEEVPSATLWFSLGCERGLEFFFPESSRLQFSALNLKPAA